MARFTTYEVIEERPLQVLKQDESVQEYDRSKLERSLMTACTKRPVSADQLEVLVDEIEDQISKGTGLQVSSATIGELVMDRLKPLDRVAYIRFASVYRNFRDPDEFQEFVDQMRASDREEARARNQGELPL